MLIRQIYDDKLAQYAYLVGCSDTKKALIVDPERDVDRYLEAAEAEDLEIVAVAETHVHADFLSGARELADRVPEARVYLSGAGDERAEWARSLGDRVRFLEDGDELEIGEVRIRALHTPGHTEEHLTFLVTDGGEDAGRPMGALTGDFVFVGDLGRPDLGAAGDEDAARAAARQLYASARAFLEHDDGLLIWPGHGAGSACGKSLGSVPQSTLGYERHESSALVAAAEEDEDDFVELILEDQPEPPLYFPRMKELNHEGVPILGELPDVPELGVDELAAFGRGGGGAVVDTRNDRQAFFSGHLPGSLHAPFGETLPAIVGSYADPEKPVTLIVAREDLDEAARVLVRIGYTPGSFAAPEVLARVQDLETIESIGFDELGERMERADTPVVLDVRSKGEYEAEHLPGAVNVAHTRLAERLDEIPEGTLFVHCGSGARAAAATAFLAREGRAVVHVDGTFDPEALTEREAEMAGASTD